MLLDKKIIYWNKLNNTEQIDLLARPKISRVSNLKSLVKSIILEIKECGDRAVNKYSEKFDKIKLKNFQVLQDRINNSELFISNNLKKSILIAKENIENFHKLQKNNVIDIDTMIGIKCQQIILPINSVGLYVPGGTAPLLSTTLMLSIPAIIAGCKNIILCSPPPISNEILYISKICGISNIFEVGGIQAIASMGIGTKTIPKVDKIFGPGNLYVTEAKRQIHELTNTEIDMIAGPSELLIIADKYSNPVFIAADVLSQAEHGIDSQVIILSDNLTIMKSIIYNINYQLTLLSRRDIIIKSLENSRFIMLDNLSECVNVSNLYAPEHLIIQTINPRDLVKNIINAGSIFLGPWSPESVGDYASGTNHVLPTNGHSVACSGLSVYDFQKKITIQELTPFGLNKIAHTVKCLSLSEKMDAHANAIQVRLDKIKVKYEL